MRRNWLPNSRALHFERLENRRLLNATTLELTRRVSMGTDDAEEKSSGYVSLSSPDIELVDDGSRVERTVGVRFQDIEIPRGATILSAVIRFTADEVNSESTAVNIRGELSTDAPTFSSSPHDLSSRIRTHATVPWTPPEWSIVGESQADQETADLSGIVDEIINQSGWAEGNSVVFLFTGSGERTAESYDGAATKAPLLEVVYEPPVMSELSRSVADSLDDAEEKSTGKIRLWSSDLELTEDDTNQRVGLRFQNITIPRGSTIVQASIQFQADEASSDPVSLNLFGELAANPDPFSSSRHNISTRPLTSASVTWEPPAWNTVGEAGPDQRTSDLAPIIQQLVDQDGWDSGNAVVVILSGSGRRVAESFDGASAPELHVTYHASPTPPPPSPAPSSSTGTFAGFDEASDVVVIDETDRTTRYKASAAKDRAFDARNASFVISENSHGMIRLSGDADQTGMYWAGGHVSGSKPWDASWNDWKYDPLTRNSAAIKIDASSATVSGMHFFNVHDGLRIDNSPDWTVQHVWAEYVRDDCIENDRLHSGKVVDSLFDGCYAGISTRPSSSNDSDAAMGNVVTLDGVLLRMEASPYPYKYDTKSGYIDENGDPWDGTGIAYGHGNLFKYDRHNLDRNVHFVIKDSVFLLPHELSKKKLSLPPEELIDEISNVTIIWPGSGSFPGELPTTKFPDGVTVLTGQAGLDFWQEKVADWHQRHPEVGSSSKPADPGMFEFPRVF